MTIINDVDNCWMFVIVETSWQYRSMIIVVTIIY